MMTQKLAFSSLLLALSLASAPTARATTTWYVDGVNGSDSNSCKSSTTSCRTIGHAISLASSGDTVAVASATYTENLTIGSSLTIFGSGASTTVVDGGGTNTVVDIPNSAASVTLGNLTIRNGYGVLGGGIYNAGVLTVYFAAITGNTTPGNALGAYGGGINNTGTLTIFDSTVNGNKASYPYYDHPTAGGGIANEGTLTVVNSTIEGNRAIGWVSNSVGGGGIYNHGMLTISNATFGGNEAYLCIKLWGCPVLGSGWDLDNIGSTTIQNSIIASSTSGHNCSGSVTSHGYNLSSDNSCNFSNSGDRNNTNPMLGPLQNNGGPTQTMALMPGSPAIDAGNPSGCKDGSGHLLTTDQRGYPRQDLEDIGGCDMGAYEKQSD